MSFCLVVAILFISVHSRMLYWSLLLKRCKGRLVAVLVLFVSRLNEPRHKKTCFVICQQQRRRSACASAQSDQRLFVRCLDSTIHILVKSRISRL